MEADDDMDIDPSIAEAMGFAGFGTQKKRKFNPEDGFVDPAVSASQKQGKGKGVNNTPLGERVDKPPSEVTNMPVNMSRPHGGATAVPQGASQEGVSTSTGSATTASTGSGSSVKPSLEEMARGVRNENGDMVYFLPSFLEDPWEHLRPK